VDKYVLHQFHGLANCAEFTLLVIRYVLPEAADFLSAVDISFSGGAANMDVELDVR
jgi:hypothetical protein